MKKDLPEKLKPIVDSWKPGGSNILYAEREDDGLTTLVLGSKNLIIATLYALASKIAKHLNMDFSELISEMVGFGVLDMMGDEDETEENH